MPSSRHLFSLISIRLPVLFRGLGWLALSLLAPLILACVLIRPESMQRQVVPEPPREAQVEEHVGWYEVDGDCVLLTYSATADLALVGSSSPLFLQRWHYSGEGNFHWQIPDDESPRRVSFDKKSQEFTWRDKSGSTEIAPRCEGPYSVTQVEFVSDGERLVGTVFLPSNESAGGAVMIHGSGTSHRDNLWYMQIAHVLAENKIAVLLPDKRGSGRSEGNWRTSSFELFAKDVETAIAALSKTASLGHKQIGLVGLSQGGHIAPLVAAKTPVSWVVNIAGGATTMNETLAYESIYNLQEMGFPESLARLLEPLASAVPKRRRPVWWKLNGSFDPVPYWTQLEIPALVIYGGQDKNAPVNRSAQLLREANQESTGSIQMEIFPDLGHGLFSADKRHIDPRVLELLIQWIHTRIQTNIHSGTKPVSR